MAEQASAAVAPPKEKTSRRRRPRSREGQQPQRQPRYHVVLWNDDDHSYQYVIAMLMELFGHPPERGYQLAEEVDTQGRAVVLSRAETRPDSRLWQGSTD